MVDLSIPIALHGFGDSALEGFGDPRLGQKPVRPWVPGETRHYVIQFTHSLFEDESEELQQRFGLELETYVPNYAYIERVSEQTVAALGQHDLVNGLFPLEAVYKESPGIGQGGFRESAPEAAGGFHLWAVLFSNEELFRIEETLRDIGATDIVTKDDSESGGVVRIVFSIASLDRLGEVAEYDTVNWIEEVPVSSPNGGIPSGWVQTGSANAPITTVGLTGRNQIVGILDDHMLNLAHCWFSDAAHATHHPLHRKVLACHGTDDGQSPSHAVFVSGILCGHDLANPNRRGIAHEAKIAYGNAKDFKDTNAKGTLHEYLMKLKGNDVHVVNASWHTNTVPPYGQDSVDTDRFAWRFERILIVGAAGNTNETMGPPGSAKNALCVGAAYVDETRSCLADVGVGTEFTVAANGDIIPTGTVEGGRRKPDLLAPGCNIESANTTTSCEIVLDAVLHTGTTSGAATCPPPGLPVFCASSYATPVVSAAAIIVRQYFVEGWYATGLPGGAPSHIPTSALIKAMLLNATEQVSSPAGAEYPAVGEGWGLLRLNRVLRLDGDAKKVTWWDVPKAQGVRRTRDAEGNAIAPEPETVTVNSNTQHLKVTLVWTEPPGVLNSANPVVNNLDLVVTSPSGAVYLGNWFRNGESAVDTPLLVAEPDPANNVEMVLVKQPEPGDWQIAVVPTEINAGRRGQGYALVVRGDLA